MASVISVFSKKSLSVDEQLNLLSTRGLLIPQPNIAIQHLKTVSYYRLSAYFEEFQESPNIFKPNTYFEDIWDVYIFDRKLRLHVMDALERIEIALRTSMVQVMASRYGAWWYLSDEVFNTRWKIPKKPGKQSRAAEFKTEVDYICRQRREDFLQHYYTRYGEPPYPPSWMLIECLSFGKSNSLFRHIAKKRDRKAISDVFGYSPTVIESTMEALRYTRNLCAHHSRLWNRWFVYTPKHVHAFGDLVCPPRTFYELAFVITKLLQAISPYVAWQEYLFDLFTEHPSIPFHRMGFQQDWQNDPFWEGAGPLPAQARTKILLGGAVTAVC